MKHLINYYLILARFIYYKYRTKINLSVTGRVLEGIAIGIYATVIDKLVDNGINFDLTLKLAIAIILTYAGITLSKKD